MKRRQLFLVRVYRAHPPLFFIFLGYILAGVYVNIKGIETTPFFIWAMFSGKHTPQPTYKITTLTYNDGHPFNLPHTYQEPKSMMVYFTLNHYRTIEGQGMRDPMQLVLDSTVLPRYPFLRPVAHRLVSSPAANAGYLPWLQRYLQSILSSPVSNINIYDRWVHYDAAGRVVSDSSKLIYHIP